MVTWTNMDKLNSYGKLLELEKLNLACAMSGEKGADRVRNYSAKMAQGLEFNYGARAVNDEIIDALGELAKESQLVEK